MTAYCQGDTAKQHKYFGLRGYRRLIEAVNISIQAAYVAIQAISPLSPPFTRL
jgi:hypothetical protein